MIQRMKQSLTALLFFILFGSVVQAYDVFLTETMEPYEIVPLTGDPEDKQIHLGILEDFPVMYEMEVTRNIVLSAQLSQRYISSTDPTKLSLMVVRQNDDGGGVTEVARFTPAPDGWNKRKDPVYGMTFWESSVLEQELGPGVYRFEVSTPVNQGSYRLTIGSESGDHAGYFKTLSQVSTTQKALGLPWIRIIGSSYVYYPIGIILLLLAIYRTFKFSKTISNAT